MVRTVFVAFIYSLLAYMEAQAQNVPVLRIDPANAYGGTYSEYFDDIEYIPLETTRESLFGFIVQLLITDNSFVITDFDTQATYFFLKNGKFVKKIHEKGNKYPNISYDAVGKRITISVFNEITRKNELRSYTTSGEEISNSHTKIATAGNSKLVNLGAGYYAASQTCYYQKGASPADTTIYLLKIYKGDSLYQKFLPYNQKEKCGICVFGNGVAELKNSPENGVIYVSTPLEHNIYRVTKDSAKNIFRLVFPYNLTFPSEILKSKDPAFIDSVRNTKWQNETTITSISNIFLNGQLLYFKTNTSQASFATGPSDMKPINFIYNLGTNKLVSVERITPDSANYYLPFYSWGIGVTGLEYSENSFYTHVSSLELFTATAATQKKNVVYPLYLQTYFKSNNRKSNPVIVRFKLKKMQ